MENSTIARVSTKIWITFQREGIHCYPQAATDPRLAHVSFLANPHRHMFHFRVAMSVYHDDREVEFILLKRELESLYAEGTHQLNNQSCEMIARSLLSYITAKYPGRNIDIIVSEDNENGCELNYEAVQV
jgi:hypothetical protein